MRTFVDCCDVCVRILFSVTGLALVFGFGWWFLLLFAAVLLGVVIVRIRFAGVNGSMLLHLLVQESPPPLRRSNPNPVIDCCSVAQAALR